MLEEAHFLVLPKDDALCHLQELVDLFILGQQTPLPFFTESAWKWCCAYVEINATEDSSEKDVATAADQAWAKAQTQFYGADFGSSQHEGDDPSVTRIYPKLEDVAEHFMALAEKVYAPLINALDDSIGTTKANKRGEKV